MLCAGVKSVVCETMAVVVVCRAAPTAMMRQSFMMCEGWVVDSRECEELRNVVTKGSHLKEIRRRLICWSMGEVLGLTIREKSTHRVSRQLWQYPSRNIK
jgi:hypothetical protein